MLFFILFLSTIVSAEEVPSRLDNVTASREWMLEVLRAGKMVVAGCNKKLSIPATGEELLACVEARMLLAMDRLLSSDVLELPFGAKLIKNHNIDEDATNTTLNKTAQLFDARRQRAASWSVDLFNETLSRAARLVRTHSLQIPLPRNVSFDIFEGRRRHRQKNDMMGLMLFGVMAMSVIAIPLGFQFLAVLGGKALMLAKLALILTSIQGLKKIATSNFSYGLYHSPGRYHYDRRWQPPQPEAEQPGLFDAFDMSPESPALDAIRPRISFPERQAAMQ